MEGEGEAETTEKNQQICLLKDRGEYKSEKQFGGITSGSKKIKSHSEKDQK